MPRLVAIDSGPVVSLFDRSEPQHQRAAKFFSGMPAVGFTTAAVVTEVMYLLDFDVAVQIDFLSWLRGGAIQVDSLAGDDLDRVIELIQKYADRPMDFADATLVAACERFETRDIASLDADFDIYRYKGRQPFNNLFPM